MGRFSPKYVMRFLVACVFAVFAGVATAALVTGAGAGEGRPLAAMVPSLSPTLAARETEPAVAATRADADADGVEAAADACPGSASGAVVDADGCSMEQRCPCTRATSGRAWRSHGHYVTCVVRAAWTFHAHGLIARSEIQHATREAAGSRCGGLETGPEEHSGLDEPWLPELGRSAS